MRAALAVLVLAFAGCASTPRYVESAACTSMFFIPATPYGWPGAILCGFLELTRELAVDEDEDEEDDDVRTTD